MEKNNIYSKIQKIQEDIGQLRKDQLNKFQNYKYVSEYEILIKLVPLLNKQKLLLTFSDEANSEFLFNKQEKEWIVKYLKKMSIVNCENPTEQITFNFWACGQNNDLAKAKGSAETYSIKYLLMKFFLVPTSDNLDPDYNSSSVIEEKNNNLSSSEKKTVNEFLKRHGLSEKK